jgi:hypothetical protein
MGGQEFEQLVAAGLLTDVEEIVITAYLRSHPAESKPAAYHWLRYEDPRPVDRLREGVEKLVATGARFEGEAVEKACAKARKTGYLN